MAVAMTMLGGVAFVMGIFYLVNHHDLDMRLYSWEVVSCTISIFVAILLFHGIGGFAHLIVHELEAHHHVDPGLAHLLVNTVEVVVLFIVMHVAIYRCSQRAVDESRGRKSSGESPSHHDRSQEELLEIGQQLEELHISLERRQELVCWTILFAHMCSFGMIHAGGAAQQTLLEGLLGVAPNVSELRWFGPALSSVGIVMPFALCFALFRASDLVRTEALSLEGKVHEIWDELAEESENEIASLSISFIVVQTVRYFISGYFPGTEGNEHAHLDHGPVCLTLLFMAAADFVALRVLMVAAVTGKDECEASADTGFAVYWERWLFILQGVVSMSFAWCLLWATMWCVARALVQSDVVDQGFGPNSASVRGVVAITISIVAFGIIYVLDCFSDRVTNNEVEKAIRGTIRSVGVLVGFSWEQAFAGGVEVVVEETCPHVHGEVPWNATFVRLGMALVMGTGVIPAWRMYVLRSLLVLREQYHEKKHGEASEDKDKPKLESADSYTALPMASSSTADAEREDTSRVESRSTEDALERSLPGGSAVESRTLAMTTPEKGKSSSSSRSQRPVVFSPKMNKCLLKRPPEPEGA